MELKDVIKTKEKCFSKREYVRLCKKMGLTTRFERDRSGYVKWCDRGTDHKLVTLEEFNAKVEEFDARGWHMAKTRTKRTDWPNCSYSVTRKPWSADCYYIDEEGRQHHIFVQAKSKLKAQSQKVGKKVRQTMEPIFEEASGGVRMEDMYGQVESLVKVCIPKSFFYCNPRWNGVPLSHVSQIDASSQYPSGVIGKLPTANGAKLVKGTAKPTGEYPFAFYLKSGHVAILNELDTHLWMGSAYRQYLFRDIDPTHQDRHLQRPSVSPDEDMTLLMREADDPHGAMRRTIEEIYGKKESTQGQERDEWKLILNAFLGCFHYGDAFYGKSKWKFAHIAAVLIARGNEKILRKCHDIGEHRILHIAVDGITYIGDRDWSDRDKGLGRFKLEALDCDYMQTQNNCYAFFKGGECVKYKHGAFNADRFGNPIDTPKTLEEIKSWKRLMEK